MLRRMGSLPRHQCMVYSGAPSVHLRPVSLVISERLRHQHRCIYLNSEPMVAGLRSYLAAAGVDVEAEMRRESLVLSSERPHLVDGRFEMEGMLNSLESELARALSDGYAGLWATGDMTWEMGQDQDVVKLAEYERRLDAFLHAHPQMGGICQYHTDTLRREIVDEGLRMHPAIFVNETLSVLNSQYSPL